MFIDLRETDRQTDRRERHWLVASPMCHDQESELQTFCRMGWCSNQLSNAARALVAVFYILFIFYCCSSTVVSIFTPPHYPHPIHLHPIHLPPFKPTTFGFVHVSFIHSPWWPFPYYPLFPSLPPLWLLSVCPLFQCLWLYFASLFVVLIRFHL